MPIISDHLDGLENKEIKVKEDKKVRYPFNLFQPYCRVAIAGASGAGKTNAFINLYDKIYPYLDQTWVVSPTIHNDMKQKQTFLTKEGKPKENVTVFDEPSNEVLLEIYEEMKQINRDYLQSIKTREAYEHFKRTGFDVDKLSPKQLVLLDRIDYDLSNLPWTKLTKPNLCLFLDDMQGLDILRGKVFESMVIKLRHYGCNLFVNVQTWKGLGVNARRNMTGFMVFKTIDNTLLKSIFEETQMLWKSYDDFIEQYRYATAENHDFLYIDTQDKLHPVRRNFNEPIRTE